ncbi:MAG TPA: MarR family transcriptional regulator [Ktedonobacterales bacterium]|jgi:DNA-binding MarR family transcriptional regulator|nr:MarR family transcriptional regulator [Ktedonobacterales bacterium]
MSSTFDEAARHDRERRETLMAQLQVLGEMASTETALFHQAAAAKIGLGITDMKALSALLQEGPMTAGQLTKRLSLTTGAVTSVIDRLERQRLVQRMPDPTDRRKVIVTVNQQTLASGDNVYLSMGAAFTKLLSSYTTEQLEFLVRFYEAQIELTKQEIAKLAANDAYATE